MGLIKTAQPALHGDQHLPDGSDPIPGLGALLGPTSFASYIQTFGSLRAWYRLGSGDGDPITGSSVALDSSDSFDLDANVGSYPPTHVDHSDLGDDDDQATQFNYPQTVTSGGVDSYLTGVTYTPDGGDTGWTMIGFVKPTTLPGASPGYVAGMFGPYEVGVPVGGAMFFYEPATNALTARWRSGASLVTLNPGVGLLADTWYHLAIVWDNAADTVALYVNGIEVASSAAAFAAASQSMFVGTGDASDFPYSCQFYGAVDEVAIFNEPLTSDELAGFITAAGGSAGTPTGMAGGALDGFYPNPGLAASVAGAGLTETSDVLSVNVDNTTLEIASDTLRVKAAGIGSSHIAADAVGSSQIAANAVGSSELASTTVGTGSYGDSTHVAAFTVDADGRLTAASNVAITGSGGGTTPADTAGWMPLTTVLGGTPDLVWDSTDSLIPTYGPF